VGHEVLAVGEGQVNKNVADLSDLVIGLYDLFLDLDCGRNKNGNLHFQMENLEKSRRKLIPRAVWFIDSHGYPSLHRRLAKKYNHVFFAVWAKRDLFVNLSSANWCPNASDSRYFTDFSNVSFSNRDFIIGFFGSKGGLDRTNDLRAVCHRHGYSYDIREIGRTHGHRWPETADHMANCKILFNKGQKHDGPNQRVIESMLVNRPLITDRDKRDGMSKLFKEGDHYLGYESDGELAEQIRWCLENKTLARSMALRAYKVAKEFHQIKHRAESILEICLSKT
jgi:hypothetical protein